MEYEKFCDELREYTKKIECLLEQADILRQAAKRYERLTNTECVSHRQFNKDIDVIRNELSCKTCRPPMYHDGHESTTVEFYHPKWPSFAVMKIVESYDPILEKWIKKYYEHEQMVEVIKFYVKREVD